MGGQRHVLTAVPPGNKPSTHCAGGKAGLDGCGKDFENIYKASLYA